MSNDNSPPSNGKSSDADDEAVFMETGVSFAEIEKIIAEFPTADLEAGTKAVSRERVLLKPPGALGRLEEITEWLAHWQGRHPPRVDRPRVCVFAANHGIAAPKDGPGASAFPATVTAQMVQAYVAGQAAINQICQEIDAELRVYEMALEVPTADFRDGPAMKEEDCARAIAYGMMAVEQGIDVLCLGEMGIGNTASAAALACVMFDGEAQDWVGPGTGVQGDALKRKIEIVQAGVDRHRPETTGPLDTLARVGGFELAAIAGAVIAARVARTPVVLDGFASTVAAAVVHQLDARGLDHCMVGHLSPEPGHAKVLASIGKQPLLDLGMRLGECSGAAVAIPLLKSAVACHKGMATFAEAGVGGAVE